VTVNVLARLRDDSDYAGLDWVIDGSDCAGLDCVMTVTVLDSTA
jgi:hypothetical protein